jgi:hypothetical protein
LGIGKVSPSLCHPNRDPLGEENYRVNQVEMSQRLKKRFGSVVGKVFE